MRIIAVAASATVTVLELNAILAVAAASAITVTLPAPSHIIADQDRVQVRKASGAHVVTVAGGAGGSEELAAIGDTVTYQWDKSTWTWIKIAESRQGSLFPQVGSAAGEAAILLGATAAEGLRVVVIEESIVHAADNAALFKAMTTAIPAGAVILSAQANLETAITGGGTTVKVGLGLNASDPDKYGLSSVLTKNAKAGLIPAWTVLSGAEQIDVCACATNGAAGNTALTSGTVRVRVVYLAIANLANAA